MVQWAWPSHNLDGERSNRTHEIFLETNLAVDRADLKGRLLRLT